MTPATNRRRSLLGVTGPARSRTERETGERKRGSDGGRWGEGGGVRGKEREREKERERGTELFPFQEGTAIVYIAMRIHT